MEFEEIAKILGMSKSEVIKTYEQAIRKLKIPNEKNQKFWEYVNALHLRGENKDGIISTD
jgi:transcription initiation factor TFIIIB Brf1 subunit/transcription initiation factor TFIIB